jgi:hypothetical protein
VQAAIAQDGAFAIAPNDFVTHKAADPDKETDYILDRKQPPFFFSDWIANDVAGSGKRCARPQDQRQE